MAVRAQYPQNVLLLNRGETEMNNKEINMDFHSNPLMEQTPILFSNEGNANRQKRGREKVATVAPAQLQTVFSLQSPQMMGLAQLQPQTPSLVSTGLRLALDEQKQCQIKNEHLDSLLSAVFPEELAAHINQEKNEIEQFLVAQGEHLRQALVERQQRHYRAILESAGRRLQEKESEIERVARYNTELEDQLARFQTESMAWQTKALAEQAAAVSLHSQLQKAAHAAANASQAEVKCRGESPAEDQESAYVDPRRSETTDRRCKGCHARPATVVLIPCRHLCLCFECDSALASSGCPACGCFRTSSLQVCLS